MRLLKDYIFQMHREYFEQKQDHPDLMIVDVFSEQALNYTKQHKIACIVNCIFSYRTLQELMSLPTLRRSLAVGGFTLLHPLWFNPLTALLGC